MAGKRRKGRPRKTGPRYRNGNLRPSHEPATSPAVVAASQPHRAGLGDRAADQKAESELGRLALRGRISPLQYLAGQKYAAQWRSYLATLDGPRSPQRGHGRGNGCNPADCRGQGSECVCDRAKRSWQRSASVLTPAEILVTARVCCWDIACPLGGLAILCRGLDALALNLGLTGSDKSLCKQRIGV